MAASRTQLGSRLPFNPPPPSELNELIYPSPYLPSQVASQNLITAQERYQSMVDMAVARREMKYAELINQALVVVQQAREARSAWSVTEASKGQYYAPYSLLVLPFHLLSKYTIAYTKAGFTKP
jgi:hypothetical protein